ncbi:muscle, skeletal receptor tyrosine-protein kinase [Elysia marginata]|uniref:Muscle, skeletal receptor tyrosine-protein kinase n=1 Tax=Elysia marginata TaxID=1093978 RepID=A0AAV4FFU1_9GAST|nr:muscle, skeletal receptor tyrosine-protein kinase [Elysia marginata]
MGLLILITCVCLLSRGVPVWTTKPSSGTSTKLDISRAPKSQTTLAGTRVSFHCKASGDGTIKIRWYVDGTKKDNELFTSRDLRITKNGTLRILNVTVHDRGIYRCRVENSFKDFKFSSPVLLTVHVPAEIIPSPENTMNRLWDVGSTRHLVCRAAGIPMPTIEWRRDGQLISAEVKSSTERRTDKNTSVVTIKSILTVKVTRSATYSCTAENFPSGNGTASRDTVSVRITAVKMPSDQGPPWFTANISPELFKGQGGQLVSWGENMIRLISDQQA